MIILILIKGSRITNQVFKLQLLVSETILQSLRTIDSVTKHGRERNNDINRTCVVGFIFVRNLKTFITML